MLYKILYNYWSMVSEVVKELEAAKAKVAELETELSKERQEKLAKLHEEFGYSSLNAFIKALREAVGAPVSGARRGRKAKAVKKAAGKARKGKRAKVTDDMKEQVRAMVGEGKTGAAIAKSLGVSLPTVHNIKKALGLVKARR